MQNATQKKPPIAAELCFRLEITQAELADLMGVTLRAINNWCNRRHVNPSHVTRLASALCDLTSGYCPQAVKLKLGKSTPLVALYGHLEACPDCRRVFYSPDSVLRGVTQ